MSWDATTPLDTETEKLGDNRIRELKQDLQTSFLIEGIFPGPDPVNPIFKMAILYDTTTNRPAALAAYAGRWFYNTTTMTIQRQDSSPAWADITAPQNVIPSGSNMVFYQATAPDGWSQVVDSVIDDRALRVTAGTGMSTGGTDSISSPPTHTHGSGSSGSTSIPHAHTLTWNGQTIAIDIPGIVDPATIGSTASASVAHTHTLPTTATQEWVPGYIDVLIATKN